MTLFGRFQLPAGSREQQLSLAHAATEEELRRIARAYRWSDHAEAVLGWIMAQRCIDLATALSVFFNGDPGRFNYLPKRDVPAAYRGAARLLDNVCLRVNSGFYRQRPGPLIVGRERARNWLEVQRADGAEGRRGRWVLDAALVEAALASPAGHEDDARRRALLLDPPHRPEGMPAALRQLLPRMG